MKCKQAEKYKYQQRLTRNAKLVGRVELCHDHRDWQSCKICASCVIFSKKTTRFLPNLRSRTRFTLNKYDFTLKLMKFHTLNSYKNYLKLHNNNTTANMNIKIHKYKYEYGYKYKLRYSWTSEAKQVVVRGWQGQLEWKHKSIQSCTPQCAGRHFRTKLMSQYICCGQKFF